MTAIKVALFDLRLAGTYDYLVPAELAGNISVGHLVLVPIGNQTRTGVVTAVLPESTKATKEIRSLLYEEVLLPPPLLRLGEWVAGYYRAPLGRVLQTMLPPGVAGRGVRYISWTGVPPPEKDRKGRQLHQLLAGGERSLPQLKKMMGQGIYALLQRLRKAELITEEERVVAPGTAPVKEPLITTVDGTVTEMTKREAAIAGELARGPLPLSRAEAVVRFKTTYTLLRQLEEKSVITVEEVERQRQREFYDGYLPARPEELTTEQDNALGEINRAVAAKQFTTFLLHGVTGSGKTEVYLRAIAEVRKSGGQALYLVPEIALTPQVISLINHLFPGEAAVLHSGLAAGERFDQWRRIARGEATVVVGARSAVFAPFPDLRLIVVDEEGEAAFKQMDMPHYHARDVAIMRGHRENAVVVLGTASPSLESYRNALAGKYQLLAMPKRIPGATLPEVAIVDMKEEYEKRRGYGVLSEALLTELKETLAVSGQVVLFLNRRGYRSVVLCPHCGHVVRCDNCSIAYTYHRGGGLLCHYCGAEKKVIQRCPQCGKGVEYHGTGTQRLEEEIRALFPDARVQRMDRDTTTRTADLESIFARMQSREIDILMGTQMVAKGLDFPGVELVGVINADVALHLPDFRAAERVFNQTLQVAGRSGRSTRPGKVVIQTFNPDHPALRFAAAHDYRGFFDQEIKIREQVGYPPARRLALLTFSGKDETPTREAAVRYAQALRRQPGRCAVKGPAPAALAKLRSLYRFQLMITAPRHGELAGLLDRVKAGIPGKVRLDIDIDPSSTL